MRFKLQRGFMTQQKIYGAIAPRFAFLALLLGNIAIAFGPLLVRYADTGPVATGFWRVALAAPFLALLGYHAGFRISNLSRPLVALNMGAGLFFGIDIVAWHIGIFQTKLGNATLFANCASLLLVIYSVIMARKLPGRLQIGAVILAFAGGALLMGQSIELSRHHFVGDILSLSAGIFYTFYLVMMIRVRATVESFGALALASACAALLLLLVAVLLGERIIPVNWTPLLILAFSSQIFGQGCLTYALPHYSPLVIGLALLLQPALSACAGWIAFGEMLTPFDFVGGMMVMVALVLVRMSRHV